MAGSTLAVQIAVHQFGINLEYAIGRRPQLAPGSRLGHVLLPVTGRRLASATLPSALDAGPMHA